MEVISVEGIGVAIFLAVQSFFNFMNWREQKKAVNIQTEANKPKVEAEAMQSTANAFSEQTRNIAEITRQYTDTNIKFIAVLDTREKRIDQLEQMIRDMREEHAVSMTGLRTEYDTTIKQLRDQYDKDNRDQSEKWNRRLAEKDAQVAELQSELKDLAMGRGHAEAEIASLKESRTTLREEVEELKKSRVSDTNQITELKAEVLTLQRANNLKDTQLAERDRRAAEMQSKIRDLEAKVKDLEAKPVAVTTVTATTSGTDDKSTIDN